MKKQLQINTPSLLGKDSNQINSFFTSALAELSSMTPDAVRESQHAMYARFCKQVLKKDVIMNPHHDPFIHVTGFPMQEFLVNRYRKMPKDSLSILVSLPNTDLFPYRYYDQLPDHPENAIIDGVSTKFVQFDFPNATALTSFRPIGPVKVSTDSNWRFNFTTVSHAFAKPDSKEAYMFINYGMFLLDAKPIAYLKTTGYFEEIQKDLTDIAAWFTHDLTGHGTLEYASRLPESIALLNKLGSMYKYEQVFTGMLSGGYIANKVALINEHRHLNLHMNLKQVFVELRPALFAYLKKRLQQFFARLQNAAMTLPEPAQFEFITYFGNIYLFCLLRLMKISTIRTISDETINALLTLFLTYNPYEKVINDISSGGCGMPLPKNGINLGSIPLDFERHGATYIPHTEIYKNAYTRLSTT